LSLSGTFESMSMTELIHWARAARRSGVLTARHPREGTERRICLDGGAITACASNDPRDYFGSYLVRLGYCGEEDVNRALQIQRETGVMFGQILVMVEKLTRDDAVTTLTEKTMDNVCDLFLWEDGTFEYDPKPVPPRKMVELAIDPIALALEGIRRAEGWNALRIRYHRDSILEPTGQSFSATGQYENPRVARAVLPLLDGERTIGRICGELPFSEYSVIEAISDLARNGLARTSDVSAALPRRQRLEARFAEAMAAEKRGQWGAAVQILEALEELHWDIPGLAEALPRARVRYKQNLYDTAFRSEDVPVVAIAEEVLERLKIPPVDGFLVSHLDGHTTVAEAIRASSLSEMDALRTFKRLLDAGVIRVLPRPAG
jgi:hypothetical protein